MATGRGAGGPATARALAPADSLSRYASFAQVLDLISANRDMALKIEVESFVRLARYAPGRIEFTPAEGASRDLAPRLAQRLQAWTGVRWGVSVVPDCTAATIAEERDARQLAAEAEARADPRVQAVLAVFPGATVSVRLPQAAEPEPEVEEADADWDPFEHD